MTPKKKNTKPAAGARPASAKEGATGAEAGAGASAESAEARTEAPSAAADQAVPGVSATPAPDDPRLAELNEALEESRAEYLRARAEVENVRRRAATDVAQAHKFALDQFARDLLVVRDSLEQASLVEMDPAVGTGTGGGLLGNMREGLLLTIRQLDALFARYSIVAVTPEPGEPFNPDHHQALSAVETDQHPANHIVQRIQAGYLLHERLLRPATVIVARAAAGTTAAPDEAPAAPDEAPHNA